MKLIPLIFVLVTLYGCSNRAVYEGIQTGNRNECVELHPSQYDECMDEANRSFNEYERERKASVGR